MNRECLIRRFMGMDIITLLQKHPVIWDIFTRKEVQRSHSGSYAPFPFYASKNRDIFEPLVSQYLIENKLPVEYPTNKPFAVCLTHDIDDIYESILSKGLSTIPISDMAIHSSIPFNGPDAFKKNPALEFLPNYGSRT